MGRFRTGTRRSLNFSMPLNFHFFLLFVIFGMIIDLGIKCCILQHSAEDFCPVAFIASEIGLFHVSEKRKKKTFQKQVKCWEKRCREDLLQNCRHIISTMVLGSWHNHFVDFDFLLMAK